MCVYLFFMYFLLATFTRQPETSTAHCARRSWGRCNKHEIFTDIDIIIHILNICIHKKLSTAMQQQR